MANTAGNTAKNKPTKKRRRYGQSCATKRRVGLPSLSGEQAKVLVDEADEILQRNAAVEAERQAWLERQAEEDQENAKRLMHRHRMTHARDEYLKRAEFHCEELAKQMAQLIAIAGDLKLSEEGIKRHLSELISSKFKPLAPGGRFGTMQIGRTWRNPKDAWVAGLNEAKDKLNEADDQKANADAVEGLGANAAPPSSDSYVESKSR